VGTATRVEARWRYHPIGRRLADFEAVEELVRGLPGFLPDTTSRAYRLEIEGLAVFIKYYQAQQDGFRWSRLMGAKPRRELRNLKLIRALGVATLEPLATGVSRCWGVFQSGYLATLEEPAAEELAVLASRHPERLADAGFYSMLCSGLSDAVRRLHRAHFFHNDLNWRNVLIRARDGCGLTVLLFDSPNGRRWYFPFAERRLIKDLAHLDTLARVYLRRTQRLKFYLAYAGRSRLTPADKKRLAAVLRRSDRTPIQKVGRQGGFVRGTHRGNLSE
jgi:hypothetical protein